MGVLMRVADVVNAIKVFHWSAILNYALIAQIHSTFQIM
jgi:hypothetical protein